jgi:hypothetical protein
MALLSYDFAVTNQHLLGQVLASNERRIAQHNARVSRLVGTPVSRAGRLGASPQFDAHVKARAVHEAGLAKAAMQLDRQRNAALVQLYRAEQRQKLQGERAIQREGMRLDRERTAAAKALDRQRSTALFAQHRAGERAAAGLARRERMDRRAIAGAVTGRIGRSLGNTLSGVGSMAVGALGIGGSIAAGSAISTQISETARASQLANQAGRPEIKGQLLREAQGTKGFTGMEALEGMGAFTDVTGDLDAARAALPELAQLSLATGAALNDLGAAAGNAFIPLADKIKDPQARMKALLTTMRAIAGQGAVGAVEVKDLAVEMAGLAAATNKFSGDPASLIKSVGAMAQAARQRGGAGTAAEAVTSVSRFVADIASKPELFEKSGIKIGTRDKAGALTQLDDPQEIMVRMLQKTGGDLGKVSNLFGVYAERAVAGFSPLYSQAEAANMALPEAQREKRGAAGEKAVRGEFKRLLAAELTPDQQRERAASRLADPDLQFKEAMKQFNAAIGSELLPVLTRLIPEFTKLLPTLTKGASALAGFVESIIKDPITGIGKLIAAKVVLDLAGAGIGAAARSTLVQLLSAVRIPLPGGAPVPLPVGGVGAGTAAGAAAGGAPVALVGAGLLAATAGMVATKQQIGADGSTFSGLAKGAAVDFVGQHSSLGLAGMALYQGGRAFAGAFGDKPPPMPGAPASTGPLTLMPEQGASATQNANSQQAINVAPLNAAAAELSSAAKDLSRVKLNTSDKPASPIP